MFAYAKKKNWMQKAVPKKNKGLLHKNMGVAKDKPIPVADIQKKISVLRKKEKPLSAKDSKLLKQLNFANTAKKMKKKKSSDDMVNLIVKTAGLLDELGMGKYADTLDTILDYVTAGAVDDGIDMLGNLPGYGIASDAAKQFMPGQENENSDPLAGTKKDVKLVGQVAKVLPTVKLTKKKPDPNANTDESIDGAAGDPNSTNYFNPALDETNTSNGTPTMANDKATEQNDANRGHGVMAAAAEPQAGASPPVPAATSSTPEMCTKCSNAPVAAKGQKLCGRCKNENAADTATKTVEKIKNVLPKGTPENKGDGSEMMDDGRGGNPGAGGAASGGGAAGGAGGAAGGGGK